MKGFIIGALVVAVAALGYMYYADQNTISIGTAPTSDVNISTE
ncbi:MAG: hypothetical protein AAFR60_00740 [Pseudomonadota bacterium]